MDKYIAIYVRRSVSDRDKGNNSLSIIAQEEQCTAYVRQNYPFEEYRVFCDDGKSAKDVQHRPQFMTMMQDARNGLVSRIIVKKYDRFSRNMREYLNITDELDKLGVSVYSLSEPFNTETKEGRMMRNNLLNFAEFERETIAARVADAYRSKARETGFYQGGKIYYGYCSERRNVNGKTGSVLVPSAQAESVRIAYELYSKPDCSLQNIIEYFRQNDIDTKVLCKFGDSNVGISHLSRILKNPLYVRADKDVYRYFASQDIEILDDVEAYDGIHGLFLHNKMDKAYLKVGYHEGLVDSATWLAVQERKSQQIKFPKTGKAITSWLVGLVRCPHCGHSYYVFRYYNNNKEYRYFRDGGYFTVNGCVRRTLKTQPDDVERIVFEAIKERISQLEIEKKNTDRVNPEAERIETEIIRIDTEVSSLLDKLSFANDALFNYINKRAEELHRRRYDLQQQLRRLLYNQKSVDTKPLSEPLEVWDSLTAQEKNNIAKKVIDVIFVSDETGIDIRFSI